MLSITPEKTYAILIGVSEFEQDEKLLPLPAVTNNIDDLERLFTHQTVMGIPSGNFTKIVNAKSDSDILDSGLTTKLSNARLETLIIYYAGHGILGKEQELYLATCNTLRSKPKYTGALSFSKLQDFAIDTSLSNIILILDCCYGYRAKAEFKTRGSKQVYLITASNEEKKLADAPSGKTYTAFTNELIQILVKGLHNRRKTLTLGDIYGHLKDRLVKKGFPEPTQVNSMKDDAFKFKIAYNRGYREEYKFDIFISYYTKMDNTAIKWIYYYFYCPLLRFFEHELRRKPKIYFAKQEQSDISPEFKTALNSSRCLIPLWTPNYCQSKWWFRYEKPVLYSQIPKNFYGVVLPVILYGKNKFLPPNIDRLDGVLDCRKYCCSHLTQEELQKHQNEIKKWFSTKVAIMVKSAPIPIRQWVEDKSSFKPDIPNFNNPKM